MHRALHHAHAEVLGQGRLLPEVERRVTLLDAVARVGREEVGRVEDAVLERVGHGRRRAPPGGGQRHRADPDRPRGGASVWPYGPRDPDMRTSLPTHPRAGQANARKAARSGAREYGSEHRRHETSRDLPASACAALPLAGLLAGCAADPANAYLTTPSGGGSYATGSYDMDHARIKPELCRDMPENKPDRGHDRRGGARRLPAAAGFRPSSIPARGPTSSSSTSSTRAAPSPCACASRSSPAGTTRATTCTTPCSPMSSGRGASTARTRRPRPHRGSMGQILELAGKTKLACWGVLTVAARDDNFVVPGGYLEF